MEPEPRCPAPTGLAHDPGKPERQSRRHSRALTCRGAPDLVGMPGFEPGASCSQSRRANQAAPHPVRPGTARPNRSLPRLPCVFPRAGPWAAARGARARPGCGPGLPGTGTLSMPPRRAPAHSPGHAGVAQWPESQPSKLVMRVRFPSPAPTKNSTSGPWRATSGRHRPAGHQTVQRSRCRCGPCSCSGQAAPLRGAGGRALPPLPRKARPHASAPADQPRSPGTRPVLRGDVFLAAQSVPLAATASMPPPAPLRGRLRRALPRRPLPRDWRLSGKTGADKHERQVRERDDVT